MNQDLLQFGLAAFVTLLVVVDPVGIAPIFVALTRGASPQARVRTIRRAISIALGISLFFLVAGRATLRYLGVSVHAFAISGGILLFATALPMLLGHRPGLQGPDRREEGESEMDVAIFPLAIPLLSGPGAIATILLMTAQLMGSPARAVVLVVVVVLVFLVAYYVLYLGDWLLDRLGESGVHVITRVLGILLAALAVQFVLNGVSGYYLELAGG